MVLNTITKTLFSSDSKYPKEFQKIITHFTSDYNLKDKEEEKMYTEWNNLIECKSGIRKINHFNTDDLTCKIAGFISHDENDTFFNKIKT